MSRTLVNCAQDVSLAKSTVRPFKRAFLRRAGRREAVATRTGYGAKWGANVVGDSRSSSLWVRAAMHCNTVRALRLPISSIRLILPKERSSEDSEGPHPRVLRAYASFRKAVGTASAARSPIALVESIQVWSCLAYAPIRLRADMQLAMTPRLLTHLRGCVRLVHQEKTTKEHTTSNH